MKNVINLTNVKTVISRNAGELASLNFEYITTAPIELKNALLVTAINDRLECLEIRLTDLQLRITALTAKYSKTVRDLKMNGIIIDSYGNVSGDTTEEDLKKINSLRLTLKKVNNINDTIEVLQAEKSELLDIKSENTDIFTDCEKIIDTMKEEEKAFFNLLLRGYFNIPIAIPSIEKVAAACGEYERIRLQGALDKTAEKQLKDAVNAFMAGYTMKKDNVTIFKPKAVECNNSECAVLARMLVDVDIKLVNSNESLNLYGVDIAEKVKADKIVKMLIMKKQGVKFGK